MQPGVLKHLYNSLVLPYLTYGLTAWGATSQTGIKRITTLQKRAIRQISHSKYNSHTGPLFRTLNILMVEDLYRLNCCKIYIRRKLNKLPQRLINLTPLGNDIHSHNTRQQGNIRNHLVHYSVSKQFISYKITTVWNSLHQSLQELCKSSKSLKTFTKHFKSYCLQSYPDTCHILNCYVCANH